MADEVTEDVFELLPSGRIRLAWDGLKAPITLRRPKLGEFKRYKLMVSEIGEELNTKISETQRAAKAAENDDELTDAQKRTMQLTALSELSLDEYIGPVAHTVIKELGLVEIEVDDMPIWLTSDQSALATMIKHWRAVPLVRGLEQKGMA